MNALVLAKKKDYVLQGNEISRSIYSCSVLSRKIISFASSLVQVGIKSLDSDETVEVKTWTARFSISDFIKKFEITDSGENYQNIRKAVEECQSSKITLEKGKGFKSYNWFYSIEFSPEKDFVEMTFSPDVGAAIYNLKNGYIAMRFSIIKNFKSLYSFRYYEIANSFIGNKGKNGNKKGCWFFEYDIVTLKQILEIKKDAYKGRINNFITWVIKKPLEELNNINNDFKIEFKKIIENRKTVGFRFECKETSKQLKIAKTDSPEVKQEKQEINEDWAKEPLWAKMQELYPEVWAEYFDQEKHSGFFVFDEVAKNATYERMLSEGYELKETKKSKSKKRDIPAKTKPENLEEPSKNEMDNEIYKLQMAKRMPEWIVVSEDLESMSKVSGISLPSKNSLMYNVTVFEEMQKRGLI